MPRRRYHGSFWLSQCPGARLRTGRRQRTKRRGLYVAVCARDAHLPAAAVTSASVSTPAEHLSRWWGAPQQHRQNQGSRTRRDLRPRPDLIRRTGEGHRQARSRGALEATCNHCRFRCRAQELDTKGGNTWHFCCAGRRRTARRRPSPCKMGQPRAPDHEFWHGRRWCPRMVCARRREAHRRFPIGHSRRIGGTKPCGAHAIARVTANRPVSFAAMLGAAVARVLRSLYRPTKCPRSSPPICTKLWRVAIACAPRRLEIGG